MTSPAGQLAFPATQNPSANANTLDDYEEGIWTPALNFGGAATGITYAASTLGRYTKIGRLVTATANLILTSKGTADRRGADPRPAFVASLNDRHLRQSCCRGHCAAAFTSVTGAGARRCRAQFAAPGYGLCANYNNGDRATTTRS